MSSAYDLLIVSDATASMGSYLTALRQSIPEILALAKLSGAFSRLGVLAYKDYSDPVDEITSWSGWNNPDLTAFVNNLDPSGGGDFPEAAKTALIRALQAVNKNSKTLILWYADGPPHHQSIRSYNNDVAEAKAFPTGSTDWVKLCHAARHRNCTVFSFTPNLMGKEHSCFYNLLSELTGGISIRSGAHSKSSALISRLTVSVILQWMGQASDMDAVIQESRAVFGRYRESPLKIKLKLINEGNGSQGYLPPSYQGDTAAIPLQKIIYSPLTISDIPRGLLASKSFNLATRFSDVMNAAYRDVVYETLSSIIDCNVSSLTYNPIFGQLWRAVCKDTHDKRKTQLLDAFSNHIGKIDDPIIKSNVQKWSEESFDATEEIESIIARANENSPMVYLDLDSGIDLTRVELLEVSRSCYSGILKKLASILTHLKLVEPGVKLTASQRSIPLTLSPLDFFRIVPHLIVPGTLYPARAASLTAILALITGVPFLLKPAEALLTPTKGTWIDLDIPENISFDCAKLLLSAPKGAVLTDKEARIYEAMRRYKLIELNLDSSISVTVPWTPEKTRGVGDRRIECMKCHISRSVTMMSAENYGICGLCIHVPGAIEKDPQRFSGCNQAESCWVECSTKTCRAQYVIEDVAALKIRPRCYYCRKKIPCPFVECTRCTNRVIVPPPYRSTQDKTHFICPACEFPESSVETIVTYQTTIRELKEENGVDWLGLPSNDDIFHGKSAYKLMQIQGENVFGGAPSSILHMAIRGKKIQNPAHVLSQVEGRVGRGEVQLAPCTLCFEETPKSKLLTACGRSGCTPKVDERCLYEWYGQSEPGKLLNIMQFACPFCRRKPTTKTLLRYNRRAASLGGLREAMEDRNFYYAWCLGCGFAKKAQERICCNEDRLPIVDNFRCQECTQLIVSCHANVMLQPSIKPILPAGHIVPCPNCEVMIEKIDGCCHITCQCSQDFCFACGKGFAARDIYRHMATAHGGIYDDDDDG